MSKSFIEYGKAMNKKIYSDVSYGDLPAKALINLDKQIVSNNNK